jgi:pyruvate kinase
MNTAHISPESGLALLKNVREVSDEMVFWSIPKARKSGHAYCRAITVTEGQIIKIAGGDGVSFQRNFYVSYSKFHQEIPVGNQVLIDDGELGLRVVDKTNDFLVCKVENSGFIKTVRVLIRRGQCQFAFGE